MRLFPSFCLAATLSIALPFGCKGASTRHLRSDGVVQNSLAAGAGGGETAYLNVSSRQLAAWRLDFLNAAQAARNLMQNALVSQEPSPEEQQCEIQREFAAKPSKCPMGNNLIPDAKMHTYLKDFEKVWTDFKAQLPGPTCCMGINHQFAIYATIRELEPAVIIESGVAAGRGTWLLRYAAGPKVPIFSLDPGDPVANYGPQKGWKDSNPQTRYFTAGNFLDLAMVRWDVHIPDPAVRSRTLVLLDDHQSSQVRLKMLRSWGFRHVFYEDNYPFGVATSADKYTCPKLGASLPRTFTKFLSGDAYSPNTVCAPVPAGTTSVLEKDRFGMKCKILTLPEHDENVVWFQQHLLSYFEFPAVWSRCKGLNRIPLLGSDLAALSVAGFPKPEDELWQYGHLFPVLMDLKPLSKELRPTLVNGESVMTSDEAEGYASALGNIAATYQDINNGTWSG